MDILSTFLINFNCVFEKMKCLSFLRWVQHLTAAEDFFMLSSQKKTPRINAQNYVNVSNDDKTNYYSVKILTPSQAPFEKAPFTPLNFFKGTVYSITQRSP